MKRKFTFVAATLMLLAFFFAPLGMWGQVVSGTTYSTQSTSSLPTGWSGQDGGGTSYIKLTANTHYIQTSNFTQDHFTSIKVKARTFGGPSAAQALITVSWYDATTSAETVLGTVAPTSTTLSNYTISSPNNPTANTNGYVKIQCKGASSSKGSGVSEVTINFVSYNITISPNTISVDHNEHWSGNGDDETLTMTTNISSGDFVVRYCSTENGTYTDEAPEWMNAWYNYDGGIDWFIDENTSTTNSNSVYFKVYNGIYSNAVHVTQSAHVGTPTTVTIEPNSGFSNDLNNSPGGLLVATVTDNTNNQSIQANVTWASSNTSVATVDQYGVVSLVAVGQTNITATYAGNSTYAGSVGTYPLTVINTAPWVTATPSTLNSFSYVVNNGPSATQTISVEGANLTGNVTVEFDGAPSNFEISQNGTSWTNSIVLAPTSGTIASTNISVRLKAGLVADGYSDVLRVKYNNSNMASINLSGSVNTITIMTVAQARDAIDQGTPYPTGVYVSGIVTRRYNNNIDNGRLSYYISDDGTQNNELEAYLGYGLDGAHFTSYNDIQAGDIVVVYGDLYYHSSSSTYELNKNNKLYSWRRPATLTVSGLSNVEVIVFNAANPSNPLLTGEGSYVFNAGDEVLISVSAASGFALSTFTVGGVNHLNDIVAGAYTFTINQNTTVIATAAQAYSINYSVNGVITQAQVPGSFQMPSSADLPNGIFFAGWTRTPNDFTNIITAGTTVTVQGGETFYAVYGKTTTSGETTVYQKVTSAPANGDWSGDYLIVNNDNTKVLNGPTGNFNTNTSGTYTDISAYYNNNNNVIEYNSTTSAYEITASATTNGHYSLYDNGDEAYLGYNTTANDNNNTGAKLRWDKSYSATYNEWTLGVGSIVSVWKTDRAIRWNNSQKYFAMYSLTGVQAINLYKKTSVASTTTTYYTRVYTNDITGYGNSTNNDKWYLITSPLALPVAPTEVTNMILTGNDAENYDLYYFNADGDTEGNEWINYKAITNGFTLEAGKGYLYANKGDANNNPNTVTLSFTGAPYSGEGKVDLTNTGRGSFAGWNLVGNPFTVTAYVDRAYYVMNENGDGFIAAERENNYVNPMEGIFVYAATSTTMTFSTTAPQPDGNNAILALNLSQGQGVMDRAIVRFDNSNTLPKLQLWGNNSQVYIPVDGKDYAVVNAQGQGELPVSFKAKENGTYTLSTNTKDVSFGYLHLIDNLTGNDVDLLATPSYSFEAKTSDYANRFKLVFATTCGDEDGDNDFAFFSNGSLVVNNPSTGSGAATLQVIDVNGRILKSESINGCANVNLNAAPGVYMIRLVNGNDVKTQKVVVR